MRRLGRRIFGPPDERVEAAIATITDRDRLHELLDRIPVGQPPPAAVTTWEELLAPGDPLA